MSAWRHQLITLLAVATACAVLASPAAAQSRRSSLFYSWHVGSAHPLGTLDSVTDANIHFAIDFGYELGVAVGGVGEVGGAEDVVTD